jgi:uncharacterized protein
MRSLLASPLGFLIGLSLGALGGGGSILAVPALVYAAGQTPKEATTTSLVLVAMTAVIGIVPHLRARRVRLLPGTLFGVAGIGGSLLGSHWNRSVDQDLLLLAFSGLMLVAAWAMWRRNRQPAPMAAGGPDDLVGPAAEPPAPAPRPIGVSIDADTSPATSTRATAVTSAGAATGTTAPTMTTVHLDLSTVAKVLAAGSFIGLLTGFFGVGGGFVIVPALVLALGFTMPEAVGTSLLVITINAVIALGSRLDAGSIDWATVIPFTITSLGGVIVGGRLAGKVDSRVLQRWFIWLLVAVAIYTTIRSVVALA